MNKLFSRISNIGYKIQSLRTPMISAKQHEHSCGLMMQKILELRKTNDTLREKIDTLIKQRNLDHAKIHTLTERIYILENPTADHIFVSILVNQKLYKIDVTDAKENIESLATTDSFTVTELVRILGIPRAVVYGLPIRNKKKVKGVWRFTKTSVSEWLDQIFYEKFAIPKNE